MSVETDVVTPSRVRAIAALLNRSQDDWEVGTALPLMWHSFFLLPTPAQRDLGLDGHAAFEQRDQDSPERRMFAGGKVTMHSPICVGDSIASTGRIVGERDRDGRLGAMRFVTSEALVSAGSRTALIDERTVVYLQAASLAEREKSPIPREPEPPLAGATVREISVDPSLLFRFSALTFNAHRIHYDRDYARDVEGYPGLVVHGPLQSLLMTETATSLLPALMTPNTFTYELVAPLFEHDGLLVSAALDDDVVTTRVSSADGRVSARGVLTLARVSR